MWTYAGLSADTTFVFSSEEIQLQRLMLRDNSMREDALSRLRSQMPIADKVAYADIVIDNSGTTQELEVQIDALVSRLNKDVGWVWPRLSWLVPPVGICSAAFVLIWRLLKLRRRSRRQEAKQK